MRRTRVLFAGFVLLPVVVAAGSFEWSWREGRVDVRDEYAELLYGSPDANPGSWTAVARVGPARGRVFPVQWLVDREAGENGDVVEAVVDELDFYLKDARRPYPWSDVLHHCNTTSNWYGQVHWACVARQAARAPVSSGRSQARRR